MGLVAVVAVATPAGQALEGGLGGLPVAAAAGRLPAGLGAQQPLRVDLVPLTGHHRRPLPAVASAMGALAAAVTARAAGGSRRPPRRRAGWPLQPAARPEPPCPSDASPARVIQAVGAPIAVQLRGGHAPHRPLARVGGNRAEFGQQPARRVQGQGVDAPTDALVGAVIGVAVSVAAYRLFVPNEIFPVAYKRGRSAHLDVSGRRGEAIRHALADQLGLTALDVEPFGQASSAGSTPLRIQIQDQAGTTRHVFGKLYAKSHLRADRSYKLWRALLYGQLRAKPLRLGPPP